VMCLKIRTPWHLILYDYFLFLKTKYAVGIGA
jgi:hypothetical protein